MSRDERHGDEGKREMKERKINERGREENTEVMGGKKIQEGKLEEQQLKDKREE